jgi:hypothetical protein
MAVAPETASAFTRAARRLARLAEPSSNMNLRLGSITALQSGPPLRVTITLASDPSTPIPNCVPIHSYAPTFGDQVFVLMLNGVDPLVIGIRHE